MQLYTFQYAMRQCKFYLMAFLFRFPDVFFFFSFFIFTKCFALSQRDLCEMIQVEINEKTYPEHNDYIDLLADLVEQLGPFKIGGNVVCICLSFHLH